MLALDTKSRGLWTYPKPLVFILWWHKLCTYVLHDNHKIRTCRGGEKKSCSKMNEKFITLRFITFLFRQKQLISLALMAILEHDGTSTRWTAHQWPAINAKMLRRVFDKDISVHSCEARRCFVFFLLLTASLQNDDASDVHRCKGHDCRFCVLLENVYVCLLYTVLLSAVYCGSSLYVSLMWLRSICLYVLQCAGDRFSLPINKVSRPNRTSIS